MSRRFDSRNHILNMKQIEDKTVSGRPAGGKFFFEERL